MVFYTEFTQTFKIWFAFPAVDHFLWVADNREISYVRMQILLAQKGCGILKLCC